MLFHRFWLEPLAQAGYLIADGDEAVVVDPRRDVDEMLQFASRHNLRIRWAIATHTHADFVAGLHEIATATGAKIGMGAAFVGSLPCERLHDGTALPLGRSRIDILATPGHTQDSVCFLVRPAAGNDEPLRLCSGDTLFLGDVGRPDLAAGRGLVPKDMAKRLFASLRDKLLPLPDATEVWPAHGAGSPCGTNISCDASSTMGVQRIGNWALTERDEQQFCERLVGAQQPPPAYFGEVVELNLRGPRLCRELRLPARVSAAAFERAFGDGVLVDVRAADAHGRGHWPGAVNLGADGKDFESWCGALLPPGRPLCVHAESAAQLERAWTRLLRIGKEHVVAWTDELPAAVARTARVPAVELFALLQQEPKAQVIDVRRPGEWTAGHVAGAVHAPLSPALAKAETLQRIDPCRRTFVICRTGYRSSAAIAQLRTAGFIDLVDVQDGMVGWTANHLPVATDSAGCATAARS